MCELMEMEKLEGRKEGRIEGRAEGRAEILVSLVNDGILTVEDAATRLDISVKAFQELMTKNFD